MEENNNKKISLIKFVIVMLIIVLGLVAVFCFGIVNKIGLIKINPENANVEKIKTNVEEIRKGMPSEYALTDNNFSKFDLSFLKFENKEENKIYSPLSIKYAFKMLEEATTGNAKEQISDVVGKYDLTKYNSNENMALANAFFIRDSFKDGVKDDYIETLKTKYNAEVKFDSFESAEPINKWVKENTLELIPQLVDDDTVQELDFALVNALGIDMEWKHKFLVKYYEDDDSISAIVDYEHINFGWMAPETLNAKKFYNNQNVSSMEVLASLNNYDIVEDLGEETIRQTVYQDFKKWVLDNERENVEKHGSDFEKSYWGNFSEEDIKRVFDEWFDKGISPFEYDENGELYGNISDYTYGYIDGLNENKNKVDYSTDFSLYVDDDVKVFAKDLKEYDGTTLQYIGIMPIKEDLAKYIDHTEYNDITKLIKELKELKRENFKDGYLTYIHGYIPKFNFEYELDLVEDLKKIGITDVFEMGKANLTNMTDAEEEYITTAIHKANIEFTQDGIKAAAATVVGGAGAGEWYNYYFDIPTEEIDITFDRPYMFLIRDKQTGETWFVGTVYEPLSADEETEEIYQAYEDREELN